MSLPGTFAARCATADALAVEALRSSPLPSRTPESSDLALSRLVKSVCAHRPFRSFVWDGRQRQDPRQDARCVSLERRQEADSDWSVVQRVQGGDVAAFGDQLIRKYRDRVYGVVYNMTANREECGRSCAGRLHQGFSIDQPIPGPILVFHLALSNRGKFYPDASSQELGSGPFLVSIRSTRRTKTPRIIILLTDKTGGIGELFVKELQEKLNEAMQKLSIKHRTVVTLFEIDGLSHEEIADVMDCSVGTASAPASTTRNNFFRPNSKIIRVYDRSAAAPDESDLGRSSALRNEAERPPIEFWTEFDRSLHAKQLAAIVEKRPWWRRSSWRQASRWSLPLSAAAALTVTFATLSHPTIAKIKLAPASLPNTVAQESQATVAQPSVTAPASQAIVARVEPVTLSKPVAPAASEVENKPTMVAVAPVSSQVQTPSANRHLASVTEQIAGLALSNDSDSPTARFAALNTKEQPFSSAVGRIFRQSCGPP